MQTDRVAASDAETDREKKRKKEREEELRERRRRSQGAGREIKTRESRGETSTLRRIREDSQSAAGTRVC